MKPIEMTLYQLHEYRKQLIQENKDLLLTLAEAMYSTVVPETVYGRQHRTMGLYQAEFRLVVGNQYFVPHGNRKPDYVEELHLEVWNKQKIRFVRVAIKATNHKTFELMPDDVTIDWQYVRLDNGWVVPANGYIVSYNSSLLEAKMGAEKQERQEVLNLLGIDGGESS